ncbi:MAG: shikimate dehydrogenase [Dehalococcoidia bacterium]|nr:shikimate dehydrogenase [Dehalococcoidia bacterium]
MGDPIEHSVSPAMHNGSFKALGLDYVYVPFRVKKEDLASAVKAMRALNICGVNVTIPHKVDIIPLLDEIDPLAREIGAVNVLVNNDGKLTGHNTDAEGFLHVLLEHGVEPEGKNVIILGAGGAARALAFILAGRGANLIMLNRTPGKAARCAADVSASTGQTAEVLALNANNLADAMERGQILVNTTSVGMFPAVNDSLVPGSLMRSSLVVADIVYNPYQTRLLAEAGRAGARIINGLEMLIWQGALAFEKWTGRKAPLNVMRKEAIHSLKYYEK